MTSPAEERTRYRVLPMRPRDPHEPGRTASSLELFFDLVFVTAVSVTAAQLHHSLAASHAVHGLLSYAVVFFGIWWAWMNFTWFATSFANDDDWLYRVLTIAQMAGVLVLAAGVEPAFAEDDYTVLIIAYVVMRVAMIAQWLRASRSAGPRRRTTQVYAAGIATLQVVWLVLLALSGPAKVVVLVALVAAEIAVPIVAERHGTTPWHPHHITERYGLFTLIVLGESLLASANAVIEAVHDRAALAPLVSISVLALVVTAAMWWIYFWPPHHEAITTFRRSLRYGYVHYFVFAAAAAFSVGVELQIDVHLRRGEVGDVGAAVAVSVPVAVFVLGVWWIAMRDYADRVVNVAVPVGAVLVLLDAAVPGSIVITAGLAAALVAVLVVRPPLSAAR